MCQKFLKKRPKKILPEPPKLIWFQWQGPWTKCANSFWQWGIFLAILWFFLLKKISLPPDKSQTQYEQYLEKRLFTLQTFDKLKQDTTSHDIENTVSSIAISPRTRQYSLKGTDTYTDKIRRSDQHEGAYLETIGAIKESSRLMATFLCLCNLEESIINHHHHHHHKSPM